MQVSINVDAALVISRAWATHPDLVMEELEQAMGSSLVYLQGQVVERSKIRPGDAHEGLVTGHLARSFGITTQVFMDAVFGEVNNPLTYALPVELGTRPHFPPLDPLINWVEAKLGLYGDDAEGAARGIQRKIGRFGTPGRFMARDALAFGRDSVAQEFSDAAERIVKRLAKLGGSGAPA